MTDKDNELNDRKHIDVSNLSVQIFGENILEGEQLPMKGQSRPQGMINFGNEWVVMPIYYGMALLTALWKRL